MMEDDDAISAVSSDSAAVMPPCSEPSTRLSCSIGTDSDNDDVLSPVGSSTDSDNDDVLSAVSSDFDGLDSSTSSPSSPPPLSDITKSMVRSLNAIDAQYEERLHMNLVIMVALSAASALSIGTGCSGIDVIMPAIAILLQELCHHFALPGVCWSQAFACECVVSKQRWLRDVMQATTVFTDLLHLARDAKGFDFVEQRVRRLQKVFTFTCGFSCKSVSRANMFRSQFQDCLRQNSGTTGKTFRAAMRIIALCQPILVWLENVAGLSQGDREYVVKELERLGYVVVTVISDLRHHGIPCRRLRIWFLACLMPGVDRVQRTLLQNTATALELALRRDPLSINRFLKTRMDTDFQDLDVAQIKKQSKREKKNPKWKDLHKNIWTQWRQTRNSGSTGRGFPKHWKAMMHRYRFTARERDICRLEISLHRSEHESDGSDHIFFDTSQSAHRVPRGRNECCTILPSGRILVAQDHEVRPLFGVEALALQGVDLASLPNAAAAVHFSPAFMTDVAGNAYSTPQACLACFISLCIFDLPNSQVEVRLRRNAATANLR